MAESEERKKYRREWAKTHKEVGTLARRKWVSANRERVRETARKYRAKNRDKFAMQNVAYRLKHPDKIKNNNLRKSGWTLDAFNNALAAQDFKCAICFCNLRALPPKQIHADHCHLTNKRRGVLCHHCNAGIGCLQDDPEILQSAMTYLRRAL
jgi:hypothetical protein